MPKTIHYSKYNFYNQYFFENEEINILKKACKTWIFLKNIVAKSFPNRELNPGPLVWQLSTFPMYQTGIGEMRRKISLSK